MQPKKPRISQTEPNSPTNAFSSHDQVLEHLYSAVLELKKAGVINDQQKKELKERLINKDNELFSTIISNNFGRTIKERLQKYTEKHFQKQNIPQRPAFPLQGPSLEVITQRGTVKTSQSSTSQNNPQLTEFMKYLEDLQQTQLNKLTMFDKKQLQKIYKKLSQIVIDTSSPLPKRSRDQSNYHMIAQNHVSPSPKKASSFGEEDIQYLHSKYKEVKIISNIKLLLKNLINVDSFSYISNPYGSCNSKQPAAQNPPSAQQLFQSQLTKRIKTEEDKYDSQAKGVEIKQSESIITQQQLDWLFFDSENVSKEGQNGYNFNSETLAEEIVQLPNSIVELSELDWNKFPTIIAKLTSYDPQYKVYIYKFYNLKNECNELLSIRYKTEESFSVLKAKIVTNNLALPIYQRQAFSSLGSYIVNTLQLFNNAQENSLQVFDLGNLFLSFGKNLLLDIFCEKLEKSFNIKAKLKQVLSAEAKSLGPSERNNVFSSNSLVLEDDYSKIIFESEESEINLNDHSLFMYFLEISHYYSKFRQFLLKVNQKAFIYKYFLRNSLHTIIDFSKKGDLKFITVSGKSNLQIDRNKLLEGKLKASDLFKTNKKFHQEFDEIINYFLLPLEEQQNATLKGQIEEKSEQQQQLNQQKQENHIPLPQLSSYQGNSIIVQLAPEEEQQIEAQTPKGKDKGGLLTVPSYQNCNGYNTNINQSTNNMINKSTMSNNSKCLKSFKSYVRQPNTWFGLKSVPEAVIYVQATTASNSQLGIHGIYMSLQEEFHPDSATNLESFYQLDDILNTLNVSEFSDPRIKLMLKKLQSKISSISTEEKVQKEYIDTQIELFTATHRDRLLGSQGSAGQRGSGSEPKMNRSIRNSSVVPIKGMPQKQQPQSLIKLRSLLHQTLTVSNIDDWDFDVNQLKTVEEKYTVTWNILKKSEYFDTFLISEEVYANFIKEMQKGYDGNGNPFHNFNHGISVMQSCYMFSKCKRSSQVLKSQDIFTLILSGLCHDVGHTGRTNNFEISVQSKLALRYHDKSVLEQHHLATTFNIIKKQDLDCNILQNLEHETYTTIRRAMISNILYTDIKQHFKLKQDFETYWKTIDFSTQDMEKIPEGQLDLLTGMIIHTADFTGAAKPFILSRQWSEKVNKEFHSQYIEEGKKGVEQTAFMKDLDVLPVMAKAEKGFLNVIVLPLWVSLNDFFEGELQTQIIYLNDSIQQWGNLSQQPVLQEQPIKEEEEPKLNLSDLKYSKASSISSSSDSAEEVETEVVPPNNPNVNQQNGNLNEMIVEMDQEESNEKLLLLSNELIKEESSSEKEQSKNIL